MPSRVVLRDLTLREGPQAAGVGFTTQDKVEIAHQMDEAGFDCLLYNQKLMKPLGCRFLPRFDCRIDQLLLQFVLNPSYQL